MLPAGRHARTFKGEAAIPQSALGSRSWLGLALIAITGVVMRLIALGYKSFWIDEIASVAIARRASLQFWRFLWHDEGNMAAYYVLLRPWLRLSYNEGSVRLLSVVPGVAAIPLMFVLARKLFGVRVAFVSTWFLALNACAIYVSQEARAYSFVVFAVLLSTFAFVRLIENPCTGAVVAYALAAGLSCYFHYFCVLVPAAHCVAVFALPAARRPWRQFCLSGVIIAIIAAPVLWLIHAQDTGHISWVQPASFLELYHLGAYLSAASGKVVGGLLLAVDLVMLGFFARRLRRNWNLADERWREVLAASLVLTPVVLVLLISAYRPAFYHRFLVICLPGWILATSLGAAEITSRGWRVAAIVSVSVLSLVSTFINYHRVTEDWKPIVSALIDRTAATDRVLYYQSVGEFAGENYRDWLPGGTNARPTPIAIDAGTTEWAGDLDGSRRVWLVLYRAKKSDPEVDSIKAVLLSRGLSLQHAMERPGVTLLEYAAEGVTNK